MILVFSGSARPRTRSSPVWWMGASSACRWSGPGGLSEATPAQRANSRLIGTGQGVHWPDVDEDITAEGLLDGAPARGPRSSFVHLAPACNACDADELRRVVDDVHHSPVANPEALLIFVAFQLFASLGPWCIAQRLDLPEERVSTLSGNASSSLRAGGLTHACDRFL